MSIDYAVTEEEIVDTCDALGRTREFLELKACTCALCAAGLHGHNWALTEQRCDCDCHATTSERPN